MVLELEVLRAEKEALQLQAPARRQAPDDTLSGLSGGDPPRRALGQPHSISQDRLSLPLLLFLLSLQVEGAEFRASHLPHLAVPQGGQGRDLPLAPGLLGCLYDTMLATTHESTSFGPAGCPSAAQKQHARMTARRQSCMVGPELKPLLSP